MRPVGYSNELFFYTASGQTLTYNFHMRVLLTNPPNKAALQRAARKALSAFPEFAVRPVIHDGKFFFEDNDADIAIFDDTSQSHSLGSDETNGYLMCLICGRRDITISFYHGLSDFVGNWSFICTLLYHYARELGFDVAPAKSVRLNADSYHAMDPVERDDPYSKFADAAAVSTWVYKSNGAFRVPEETFAHDFDGLQNFDIEVAVADVLAVTRRYETSLTPLLVACAARAIKRLYSTDGLPIVVKMPVNLRPVFKTNTFSNFSDSAIFSCTDDMDGLDLAQYCRSLRNSLTAQLRPENFARTLAKKKAAVISYERRGGNFEQLSENLTSTQNSRPITCAITYPGVISLPEDYGRVVRDFNMLPAAA